MNPYAKLNNKATCDIKQHVSHEYNNSKCNKTNSSNKSTNIKHFANIGILRRHPELNVSQSHSHRRE